MLGYLERRSQVTSFSFTCQVYSPRELTGLEAKQTEITRPPDLDLPPSAQLPHEDVGFIPHVALQAILVLASPDVDLRLWNETVAEMEASGVLGGT